MRIVPEIRMRGDGQPNATLTRDYDFSLHMHNPYLASAEASPTTEQKMASVYFSESSSNLGAITLHGPHHVVE